MPKILTLQNYLPKKQLRRKYLSCQHSQEKKRRQALSLIAEGEVANTVAETLGMSSGRLRYGLRYDAHGVTVTFCRIGVKCKAGFL